jgi:hypothetical protein
MSSKYERKHQTCSARTFDICVALSQEGFGCIVGNPVLVDEGSIGVGSTQTFGSDPYKCVSCKTMAW